MNWSPELKGVVWTEIIAQKILNQTAYLGEQGWLIASQSVLELYRGLEVMDPSNREGHAARTYFNTLFGKEFSRELDNDLNAGLDYGYTLLMSLFAREIVVAGCLTQIGLKHTNQFNAFNLASDLMEPFRPLVDQIVYDNRHFPFERIKRELFQLFTETYSYGNKKMYLTNIVSDYTKKVVKALNGDGKEIPVFRI